MNSIYIFEIPEINGIIMDYVKQIEIGEEWNKISEKKDNDYWAFISKYQNLSEDFIREFKDRVNWPFISAHQNLSEDFIREFKDRVYWPFISARQKLSEDFIREFKLKNNK